jgi:hypothetical protein
VKAMSELDIAKLTRDAEAGNGCSIKDTIQAMPFEESLKTLKAIQDQNSNNREEDSSLPQVFMVVRGNGVAASAELEKKAGTWSIPDVLATDKISYLHDSMAQRTQTCIEKR